MTIRVLLADDRAMLRDDLKAPLEAAGSVYGSGWQAAICSPGVTCGGFTLQFQTMCFKM